MRRETIREEDGRRVEEKKRTGEGKYRYGMKRLETKGSEEEGRKKSGKRETGREQERGSRIWNEERLKTKGSEEEGRVEKERVRENTGGEVEDME